MASLGAVAFALSAFVLFSFLSVAPRAYSASPTPTLLVTNGCTRSVTAYSAASNGDVSPLAPAPTGLGSLSSVAVDTNGNSYVAGDCGIHIYAKGSNGPNAAPIAIIVGKVTPV